MLPSPILMEKIQIYRYTMSLLKDVFDIMTSKSDDITENNTCKSV